ncbi:MULTISPECIES: hypothetical protein [unclassified Afipia]|uniref:hypothetical protein n=1 Tax=unclassified Afipia TaxID=2642050 RepID=UPI0004280219|nr:MULTISPECIES: hypothetical protein [unclassified Afipia]
MTQDRKAKSDEDNKTSKWMVALPIIASALVRIVYALGAVALIFALIQVVRASYSLPAAIDPSKFVDQHGPAVLGIPIAAIAALLLVSLTRALDGPMSFDLFGLKSEGAAATCIIWAVLFLVISLTLRALW